MKRRNVCIQLARMLWYNAMIDKKNIPTTRSLGQLFQKLNRLPGNAKNILNATLTLANYKLYAWMETQTTNQWQCNHGRWLEANVGQQYR